MKRSLIVISVLLVVALIGSCDLFSKKGPLEGVNFYAGMGNDVGTARSGIQSRAEGDTSHTIPMSGKIAVTKCWLPTAQTYEVLRQFVAGNEGIVLDPEELSANDVSLDELDFYKALTRTDSDPYVFSTSAKEPFTPETLLPYDATYKGILLETLYWEFEMSDFSIRWYQRDSGDYKRGDVLVNDGSGWKWAYLKRSLSFTFTYDNETSPASNQISDLPASITAMPIEVILSSIREPEGAYFENWIGAHRVDVPDADYVYRALIAYDYDETHSLYAHLREESRDDTEPYDDHQPVPYTLIQYYNIAGDTRNDAEPGEFAVGQNPLELWPEVGSYVHPNTWDRGLHPFAFVSVGGGSGDLDNPTTVQTFSEADNEAKVWLFQIDYAFFCQDDGYTGLCFSAYNQIVPEATWANIKDLGYFFTLNPIAAGIDLRVGWMDFNDDLQGEFNPNADS